MQHYTLLRTNITAFLLCLSSSLLLGQNAEQVEYSLDDCLLFSLDVDNSLQLQQIKISLNALDIKLSLIHI